MTPLRNKNQFLYLLLAAFVFIASSALALGGKLDKVIKITNVIKKENKTLLPIPQLREANQFPILSAQAAIAFDLQSGITLYEKNADSPLLPASTTKIITALVSMDYYSPETILTTPSIKVDGQKMGLKEGEEIKVSDLMYGLLVYSANDAAEMLAMEYPGGKVAFVSAMNKKAKELSMENTYFENPSGLDGNGQVTTARDLIRASEVAMRKEDFAKIVGTKSITVRSVDGKIAHRLANINALLGQVAGVLGVKTGWTENARENLVTYIDRDGHKVMIALLGSQDRFGETKELINWIYDSYTWNPVSYSP